MRSTKQKASANAYKFSLQRHAPFPPKPEPASESWWLKPNFYEEAKKERVRMGVTAEGMKLPPVVRE